MNTKNTTTTKTQPSDPGKHPDDGKTKVAQDGEKAPRLPHERDQSSDSQQTPDGKPTEVGRKAHDDVERGVVDTDRGPEADRVYNDKVKR
ncbi:hypothetical protein VLK31_24685 [Variovorax sp. H27-G14]|uniref:hypothetical protein n=1 Tax=Variovorax sp. H27-G14 TaxID=3111914 RepID=UPI0038FD1446